MQCHTTAALTTNSANCSGSETAHPIGVDSSATCAKETTRHIHAHKDITEFERTDKTIGMSREMFGREAIDTPELRRAHWTQPQRRRATAISADSRQTQLPSM
jgi:hypothetical protein